jgi:alkaline phosphatase
MKFTALISGVAVALTAQSGVAQENAASWYEQGAQRAASNLQAPNVGFEAKNVILFIGDGMGVSTVTAARILEGQLRGETGEENSLSFEQFPHIALAKTYNTNQQTPDSAGTMTAMVSGIKTKAGVIGVDQSVLRRDCASASNSAVITAMELAEVAGMSTGLVSTARITHATPAATYAKSPERNWEDDHDLSDEAVANGCKDIARQLVEFPFGDGIDVAMGGGRRSFWPRGVADPEDANATGERDDGRNLTEEWTQHASNNQFVWNKQQFGAIDPAASGQVLGLFERSHLEFEADREQDAGGEPSLSEMTEKSIDLLSRNERGYFLMVESGRIDHAHHGTNAYRALTDAIEFSNAVRAAVEKVDLSETLIIVTADHSHVFTLAGYPTRGNDILGKVMHNDSNGLPSGEYSTDAGGMPYTTVGYTNGPGYAFTEAGRPDLTNVDTAGKNYLQETLVPLGSETHAAEDVAIYATGPGAQAIRGTLEQNVIFHVIAQASPRMQSVLELLRQFNIKAGDGKPRQLQPSHLDLQQLQATLK